MRLAETVPGLMPETALGVLGEPIEVGGAVGTVALVTAPPDAVLVGDVGDHATGETGRTMGSLVVAQLSVKPVAQFAQIAREAVGESAADDRSLFEARRSDTPFGVLDAYHIESREIKNPALLLAAGCVLVSVCVFWPCIESHSLGDAASEGSVSRSDSWPRFNRRGFRFFKTTSR